MIEVDTFEHVGLTIRIGAEEYVDDNDNPRKNCDGNIGVMFCEHPHYSLGDEDAEDPRDHDELSLTDYLKSIGCRVALPLFLYDHAGITISAGGNLLADEDNFDRRGRFTGDGAGWDTSSVGLIYHSPELCERWGRPETDDAKIEEELRNEVGAYATYLEGGVYYFQVLRAVERDGEPVDAETGGELDGLDDAEVLDTCGGFLDSDIWKDDCYTKQEARSAAEACRERLTRERAEAHAMACRDIATVTR